MRDLSYVSFFGKKVNHNDALKDKVSSSLCHIIADHTNTSEKEFKGYDIIMKKADKLAEENFEKISKLYNDGKRIAYIAELIFDENRDIVLIDENKIVSFDDFKRI